MIFNLIIEIDFVLHNHFKLQKKFK